MHEAVACNGDAFYQTHSSERVCEVLKRVERCDSLWLAGGRVCRETSAGGAKSPFLGGANRIEQPALVSKVVESAFQNSCLNVSVK